jgi:hypothetical protein
MKGAATDPTLDKYGHDLLHTHGSEWNRIFYRLTENVYLDNRNKKTSEEPFVHLAQYTEADLILDNRLGKGSFSWCQETVPGGYATHRGHNGVSYTARYSVDSSTDQRGWRPVLERV